MRFGEALIVKSRSVTETTCPPAVRRGSRATAYDNAGHDQAGRNHAQAAAGDRNGIFHEFPIGIPARELETLVATWSAGGDHTDRLARRHWRPG